MSNGNGSNGNGHAKKRGRKPSNRIGRNGQKLPRTAPGPLTPNGTTHVAAHREAAQQATATLRRQRALNLYVFERLTMQQIATHLTADGLPCSNKTVCTDIHRALEEVNRDTVRTMAIGQAQESMRLDQADRHLLPFAFGALPDDVRAGPDGKPITTPLRAAERVRLQLDALSMLRRNGESRRKLFGWDAAPDEGFIRVEQVAAMMRGLVGDMMVLTEDNLALRRGLAAAMRRRLGMMAVVEGETVQAPADGKDEA